MSRTDRRILPMEELRVREQFPRYIDSVLGTGVLLQLEDGLRRTICIPCDLASSLIAVYSHIIKRTQGGPVP
jgi:hypothetical protein